MEAKNYKTYAIYDYVPKRFTVSDNEKKVRNFIYRFKDGEADAIERAAETVARMIGARRNCVFVCIPASNEDTTNKRYKYFAYLVCKKTGMMNGMPHVNVTGEKKSLHQSNKGDEVNRDYRIEMDDYFFDGKKVIVFDDIITRGFSFGRFAKNVERSGASVIGGLFLAKTKHTKAIYN